MHNITKIYDEKIDPLKSVYIPELRLLIINPNYHNKG